MYSFSFLLLLTEGVLSRRGLSVPDYLVDVLAKKESVCSGVLYLPDIVITTAMYVQRPSNLITVCSTAGHKKKICSGILGKKIHPRYSLGSIPAYNMALLKLKHKRELKTHLFLDPGFLGMISQLQVQLVGWGWKKTRWEEKPELKHINLSLLDTHQCQISFPIEVHSNSSLCARDKHLKTMENYISDGSPILFKLDGSIFLVGIASWSTYEYFGNAPNIFSRVSSFSTWIQENAH
ncbi:hypothetical protein DSO57_1030118 [Entomophthora muscae]|uniref:Uncharacterized protein n=1 Tax=Entomophthora muscae TaxID=34485 RepID=A0ACC2UAM8_9FUNG|nr:hypothetical protein DSO57_1030118 [Entomophthora muscae]